MSVDFATSSKTNEWYTPGRYIEAAREVLGGIDLDPASCELANRTVRAARFHTKADNGLCQYWRGRVWLNPPYGKVGNDSAAGIWLARLRGEFRAGRVSAGIALVNASTSEAWFQPAWDGVVCFTDHRIRFNDEQGRPSGQPTKGNAFVYYGPGTDAFTTAFSRFGRVVLPMPKADAQAVLL